MRRAGKVLATGHTISRLIKSGHVEACRYATTAGFPAAISRLIKSGHVEAALRASALRTSASASISRLIKSGHVEAACQLMSSPTKLP